MKKTEQFFNKYSIEYEKNSKNQYFSRNIDWIVKYSRNLTGTKILDVGCGTGLLLKKIDQTYSNVKLFGLDISESMLDKSRENIPSAEFVKGDVHNMPYADSTFDFIFSSASFHHYEHPLKALNEMKRVLKKGGEITILDSTLDPLPISIMPHYWDYIDSKECYSKHLKQKEFINLFKEVGLYEITYKILYKPLPVVHILIKGEK